MGELVSIDLDNKNLFGFDSSIFITNNLFDEDGHIKEITASHMLEYASSKFKNSNNDDLEFCQYFNKEQEINSRIGQNNLSIKLQNKGVKNPSVLDPEPVKADLEVLKEFLELNPVNIRSSNDNTISDFDAACILCGDINRWQPELAFGVFIGDISETIKAGNIFIDTNENLWLIDTKNDELINMNEKSSWNIEYVAI